ncbi:MAG: hypothetical protein KIH03_07265 [Paludibacteraceae bacterium]|nr:hypothetical protein [Paludibacteraceae bacterium]
MALGEKKYNANLPNGDLDDFLSDMNEEKASYSDTEDEGLDNLFGNSGESDAEETYGGGDESDGYEDGEEEKVNFDSGLASLSAEFAAMITDLAIPALIAMFVKCNPERLQATTDQLQKLTKAYTQYLQTKQIQLTPGWMLIGVIASIYGTKIPVAMQEQKLKEKEEELRAKEKELELRMKEFDQQRKETAHEDGYSE